MGFAEDDLRGLDGGVMPAAGGRGPCHGGPTPGTKEGKAGSRCHKQACVSKSSLTSLT